MKTANKFSYLVVSMIAIFTIFAAILCVANSRLSNSHAIVASEGGPIIACKPGNPNCVTEGSCT